MHTERGPAEASVTSVPLRRARAQTPGADDILLAAVQRVRAHLDAIGRISQADALLSGDVEEAARLVTEAASRVTGCERVNVWLFNDAETELRCIDAFEATPARHTSGVRLTEEQYRPEFRALKASRYVNADDPLTDPRTAGYVEAYLKPLGITSMLDVVIHASGRNLGLLCLEHVRRPHHWEEDEIAFACQLADKVALALVNQARRRAETTLRESEERYRQLVESTTDYIWEVDAHGTFTYVSPRMADLLGCRAGAPMCTGLCPPVPALDAHDPAGAGPQASPRSFSMVESTVVSVAGRQVVLESSGTPVLDPAGAFNGYRGISRDVTRRNETTGALAYRDTVLHAVMTSSTTLVAGATLADSLPSALGIVGSAIDVDRVTVFRLLEGSGLPEVSHAWHAPGVPQVRPDLLHDAPLPDARRWLDSCVAAGDVTTSDETTSPVPHGLLDAFETRALALVPITVDGRRWGFIGVDDRRRPRRWTSTEIDSLRTLSEVMGSLIAREAAQAALRHSEQTFRTVTEAAQDGIVMLDAAGHVCFWNPAAERILGYTRAEAIGQRLDGWLAPSGTPESASRAMPALVSAAGAPAHGGTMELTATRRDGTAVSLDLSIAPMELGTDRFAVGILRDVSDRKRAEAEMHRLARFDTLSGLANRAHFADAVQQAIARTRRDGHEFAVLYLDIDHFKDINDTLGHPVGDRLLQAVADRLRSRVRATDTIARFGGDEFAILQTNIQEAAVAGALADTLLGLLAQPFVIEGNEIRTGASVGITIYGTGGRDVEALLAHADIALYRAKSEGRGTYRFFTDAMDAEVRTRVTLSTELRHAISVPELFLLYQPQVDLETGRLVGVEALLRWRHPHLGVIAPGAFITAAERSGLIVALGDWVLTAACRQARIWLDAGIAPDVVAINVSPLQFRAPLELERSIRLALATSGFPPERLELELTETALMETSRDHNDVLQRLRAARIRLSIDDFGTGYSSLDYLRRFPVDRIKIAQSFVSGLASAPENAAIVKAALGLTRELGLGVIAEGVENAEECDLLRGWGCPQAQGNYFARPMSVDAVSALLRHGHIAQADARAGHHSTPMERHDAGDVITRRGMSTAFCMPPAEARATPAGSISGGAAACVTHEDQLAGMVAGSRPGPPGP